MNAKTKEALQESIAHWTRLSTGKRLLDESFYSEDCPLCALFSNLPRCKGCPVSKKTRKGNCVGTPWHDAANVGDVYGRDSVEFKHAANLELEFLKSLLP